MVYHTAFTYALNLFYRHERGSKEEIVERWEKTSIVKCDIEPLYRTQIAHTHTHKQEDSWSVNTSTVFGIGNVHLLSHHLSTGQSAHIRIRSSLVASLVCMRALLLKYRHKHSFVLDFMWRYILFDVRANVNLRVCLSLDTFNVLSNIGRIKCLALVNRLGLFQMRTHWVSESLFNSWHRPSTPINQIDFYYQFRWKIHLEERKFNCV